MAPQHLSNCFWAAANLQEEPPLIDVIFLLEAMLSPEALLLGPETPEDFNAVQPETLNPETCNAGSSWLSGREKKNPKP